VAIFIEGEEHVLLYGEVDPESITVSVDELVTPGQQIASVNVSVLKSNKGRPVVMLHLECLEKGIRKPVWWNIGDPQPSGLFDPLPMLRDSYPDSPVFDMATYRGEFVDPKAPLKESPWWQEWNMSS
jgi:hypothetical protein